ncbi:hypothetical protein SBA3_3270001 [Candidatus Sulfopaludibacter sp. SbA3]|nr:hypothetical protein SBA3_3270001 [Candidatus Sulfopaludibacter sp. SbA3]
MAQAALRKGGLAAGSPFWPRRPEVMGGAASDVGERKSKLRGQGFGWVVSFYVVGFSFAGSVLRVSADIKYPQYCRF